MIKQLRGVKCVLTKIRDIIKILMGYLNLIIELTNGKSYQLNDARCLIQYPTLKEINITIDEEGNRINEKFEPFTKNITSWDGLWSKTMKEDIVVDIDTDLKRL